MLKLNVGSGYFGSDCVFAKDWTCVDINYDESKPEWQNGTFINFDITGKWPLETNSVDCIFASHILEHVEYYKLVFVLRGCFRVLKPGAPIRVICPDPRKFIDNWKIKNKQFLLDCFSQENYDRWDYGNNPGIAFSDMFFEEHYAHSLICSIDIVSILLMRIGFSKITELSYGNTEFPQFFGSYAKTIDNRPHMSYFLEAVK